MKTDAHNEYQSWMSRLDGVKEKYDIETDAELAVFLDLSKQRLQQFRAGASKKIPMEIKFQIWNLEGMTKITEEIWNLLPVEKAMIFKQKHNALTHRLRVKNRPKA